MISEIRVVTIIYIEYKISMLYVLRIIQHTITCNTITFYDLEFNFVLINYSFINNRLKSIRQTIAAISWSFDILLRL